MRELRQKIDGIDQKIIKLLIKRLDTVKKIGKFKKQTGLPVQDKKREKELKDKLKKLAGDKLSSEFIDEIYDVVLEEGRRVQNF